jgi:isoquinoline 1-oxidoreductase beta subunit
MMNLPLLRYQDRQITRRDFLKVSFTTGGALLIGTFLDACAPVSPTEAPAPTPNATQTPTPLPPEPFQPNLFIRINPDGTTTMIIHRSEMGQGVRTSLAMILADELEADWSTVRIEQMDARRESEVNQITSGSGSILISYDLLREAAAHAREILIAAAAQSWGVAPEECKAEASTVVHTTTGKRLGYGELVGIASDLKLTDAPQLKDPQDFKLIGTSVPRVDEPDIITGKAVYGMDVRVPGMLYAVVARCPVIGGKVASYDSAQAESVPGVQAIIEVPSGVAVVAENTWSAIQGRTALNIVWDEGTNAALSSASIHQTLADTMNKAIAQEASTNFKTIEAVYETPYLAHAALEPVNCVADVKSDHCELWLPTQNPQAVQEFVRDRLGMATDVHVTLIGGGFGRKLEVDFALEAAEVSKAIGGPVQVVWTRDDDIQHDFYRQVTYHWLKAGWDNNGTIQLWRHYIAAQGINGVAYQAGKDVLERDLVAPYEMNGSIAQGFLVNFPVPTGPWRGVVSATNAYASECFLDEVAAALKKDPYEFRTELLSEGDHLRSTLQLAAEKADWGAPPPEGRGRGVACHKMYGWTSVAMVAEVSVQSSLVRVHKVTCAVNCGRVIHPDMVVQQMEGGIVFGLTSLLKGEITFENGRVQQSSFQDYPLLQLNEMPEVEVHIVDDDRPPQGIGEMAVSVIVPAVANAVFNATGIRVRHTPIRPEDLQV